MEDRQDAQQEEDFKEFLEFYNAVQSKRYFLSDPAAKPFAPKSTTKNIAKLESIESFNSNRCSVTLKPLRVRNIENNDEDYKPIVSQNNWIPDKLRAKQMEREAAILNDSVQRMILLKNRSEKKLKKLSETEFEVAKRIEAVGKPKLYQLCGCCMIKYLVVNLPFKVPKKAVFDARKLWRQQNGIRAVGDVFTDMNGLTKREATQLYDYTHVCIFCAQFFNTPEEYRPSYEQVAAEGKQEQLVVQQKHDDLKWDPLALLEADRKMQKLIEDANSMNMRDTMTSAGDFIEKSMSPERRALSRGMSGTGKSMSQLNVSR